MERTDFGWALTALRLGSKVCRTGWNGKGMWIFLSIPDGTWVDRDGNEYTRRPYLYMKTVDNAVVPWVASQTDILADDWQIVE